MRFYKYCAVSAILSSLSLAACGAKTDSRPEIFDQISQSAFFSESAAEIGCAANADFPAAQYYRVCFQFNPVTIPSLDKANETGLKLGLSTRDAFKDLGWTSKADDTSSIYFFKADAAGCEEKLFFLFSGVDNLTPDKDGYPVEFAPRLSFSKLRQAKCPAP